MQPLQQEHLARLSLVHCRLRKSSRIVQCLSHSTGLSPCQHLSQIWCQCQSPCPHLSSGPWKGWSLYPCQGRSPRRSQRQ